MLRLRPAAVAEPGPRLKHRPSIMVNVIAKHRISSKPQKLQVKSATEKIRRGSQRKVGPADRKTWLPCHGPIVEQSWSSRGAAREMGIGKGGRWRRAPAPGASARWQRFSRGVQAEWRGRAGSGCVVETSRLRPSAWDEPVQASAWIEAVQASGSDGARSAGCSCRPCWAASIRNDFGVQPNSSLNSLLK